MINGIFYDYEKAYENGVNLIGGKAFSVCQLKKNNIEVPRGVIIPYSMCNLLLQYSEYEREKFVTQLIESLPFENFAVRSSAIGEDSKTLSWAGCFETFLEVKKEDLLVKIVECINSLNNDRVKSYAKLHDTAPLKKIAVIVQEYIPADYNGICFTVNPITDNADQMVIEYQEGKSGSVVGGNGNPNTLIVENNLVFPSFLENVVLISRKIERIFGCPMDIEWVIFSGKLIITQARPLTTL